MLISGILAGLCCALLQSGAYIFSRLFVLRSRHNIMNLLVLSHLLMGLMSAGLLPGLLPESVQWRDLLTPALAAATGFYALGQTLMLVLVRRATPSSVAPLLGLKVVVLALLNLLVFGVAPTASQWVAVVLCATAALMLTASGTLAAPGNFLLLLICCAGYSGSDLGIARLIAKFPDLSLAHAACLSMCLCYAVLGIVALAILPFRKWPPGLIRHAVRFGLPFTGCWYAAMAALYYAIGILGPVYAVILQSTRGLWSILLGAALAHIGFIHIEEKVHGHIVLRRLTAAAMMIVAIWLYSR